MNDSESDIPKNFETPQSGPDKPAHTRRKRYSGKHPRKFDERYKELNPQQYPEMIEHIRAQSRTPAGAHVPIMLAEVMEKLTPREGEVVCDCTLGYGGHAVEFMKRIGSSGRLIGIDVDAAELERTRQRLAPMGVPLTVIRSNFAGIGKALVTVGVEGFDVIFADLGVSSMQLDDPARGFSYSRGGPLDMRMDDRLPKSAADLVAALSQDELTDALAKLADEEDAQRVARAIVRARQEQPIRTTAELAQIVSAGKHVDLKHRKRQAQAGEAGLHPAAKTFQALRMLVNDELGSLKQFLRAMPYCLKAGGRIGILTFHSGEERLVDQALQQGMQDGLFEAVSDEAMRPTKQEIYDNPRSSAARFRWAKKK